MQRVNLEVELREKSGKGPAREIRRSGRIPAVLYGGGKSTSLVLNPLDIKHVIESDSGENALINLKFRSSDGKQTTAVAILREFQRDPVTREFLHVDLFEISMDKLLRIRVPLVEKGMAPGVKDGGILQHNLRDLEIECLPTAIPDYIEMDISGIQIGESIHVRDLRVSEGITILEDPDQTVLSIVAPITTEKLESMLATAPTESEGKEPEVTTKGKEKDPSATPEGGAPEAKTSEKS